MLKDIVAVKPLEGCRLHLRFEDGQEGIVDITEIVEFSGVFAPLKDPEFFARVSLNPEWGTVYWPNGADLDPDILYSKVTGEELPHFEAISRGKPSAAP